MRKRITLLLLVSTLLTSCGGPSEQVMLQAIGEAFGDPNGAMHVDLRDIEAQECELSQNDKASRGIEERWVVRFKAYAPDYDGKMIYTDEIKGGVFERDTDGHWRYAVFKFGC